MRSFHDPVPPLRQGPAGLRRWRRVMYGWSAAAAVLIAACSSSDTADTADRGDAAETDAGSATTATAAAVTAAAAPATSAAAPSSTAATGATGATGAATPSTTAATPATAATSASGLTSISVPSTPEQYFVLYVRPDLSDPLELPVAIARGKAGTTTLTDGRSQLPSEHYRVATLSVAAPGDVDGDGVDDLTELADPKGSNPLNPAPRLELATGAVIIADQATFETLSYQGDDVARDAYLSGLEFVKFWIVDTDTDHPAVYFMNTQTYRAHPQFGSVVGISSGPGPAPGKMRGDIVYNADAIAPDGSKGVYRFAFQPNDAYSFQEIALAYEALVSSMPMLRNNLLYYPFPQSALPLYQKEKALYDAYRVPVMVEQ